MVTAAKTDDARAAGGRACDLDGVFDRFGAGGQKQGFFGKVAGRLGIDAFSQFNVGLVRDDLKAGVGVSVELVLDGLDDGRMAVTGVQHRDATGKINEAAAFNVPEFRIVRAGHKDLMAVTYTARNRRLAAGEQGGVGQVGFAVHELSFAVVGSQAPRVFEAGTGTLGELPRR